MLVVLALIPHLILAGGGIDRLLVQMPGRHRVGLVAFANWSRATDLCNELIFYPMLGISGPLFTLAALILALVQRAPNEDRPAPVNSSGPVCARFIADGNRRSHHDSNRPCT